MYTSGGQRIVYDFDPAQMRMGRGTLVKMPRQADPDFSYARPNALCGIRYFAPDRFSIHSSKATTTHSTSSSDH